MKRQRYGKLSIIAFFIAVIVPVLILNLVQWGYAHRDGFGALVYSMPAYLIAIYVGLFYVVWLCRMKIVLEYDGKFLYFYTIRFFVPRFLKRIFIRDITELKFGPKWVCISYNKKAETIYVNSSDELYKFLMKLEEELGLDKE